MVAPKRRNISDNVPEAVGQGSSLVSIVSAVTGIICVLYVATFVEEVLSMTFGVPSCFRVVGTLA